jgi:chloramphenicol O-acetyltransferase type A
MKRIIDLENWNRKEHYHFFSSFDEPFFGIVATINCTNAYNICKEQNWSFYLYYLFQSLKAANEIEEFKYRIENENIVIYDQIHASSTISREDHTFAFSFIPFTTDFNEFCLTAKNEIDQIRNSTGLRLNENTKRLDVIHFSTIPWINFTGVTHARNFKYKDSVPKITFGKFVQDKDKLLMPVSINAHHGLMDGYHVGRFLELFEQLMSIL